MTWAELRSLVSALEEKVDNSGSDNKEAPKKQHESSLRKRLRLNQLGTMAIVDLDDRLAILSQLDSQASEENQ